MDVKDQVIIQLLNRVAQLEAHLAPNPPVNAVVEEEEAKEEQEDEEATSNFVVLPQKTGLSKSQKKSTVKKANGKDERTSEGQANPGAEGRGIDHGSIWYKSGEKSEKINWTYVLQLSLDFFS